VAVNPCFGELSRTSRLARCETYGWAASNAGYRTPSAQSTESRKENVSEYPLGNRAKT
jgi:hypothetical protein